MILSVPQPIEARLREPLARAGFQADVVQSTDAMVALANVQPRPLAILASVPGVPEGIGLYWELRARLGAGMPALLLIVTQDSDADSERLTQAGVAAVFVTPFLHAHLMRRLHELATAASPKPARPVEQTVATVSLPRVFDARPPPARAATVSHPPSVAIRSNPFAGVAYAALPLHEQDTRAGVDVDFRSLAGEPGAAGAPSPADSSPAKWPGELPSIETSVAALVAKTLGAPLAPGADEAVLAETWKALSNIEIEALRAVSGQDDPTTSGLNISLRRIAAQQHRLRTALTQAERIMASGARVEVDDAFVARCRQEIDAVIKDSLDPMLQMAVTQGQLGLLKQFRAVREALLQRRQELDRAAARLRGVEHERVVIGRLDLSVPSPEPKRPMSRRFKTRLLQISTVTAQSVRDHGPMLVRVMAVLAVVSLSLHAFVFDTFGVRYGPKRVEKSVGVLGVEKLDFFEGMEQATVNSTFDVATGLPQLARDAEPGTTLVIVDGDTSRILATVGRDRLQEMAHAGGASPATPPTRPNAIALAGEAQPDVSASQGSPAVTP
jgi:hypothetical protein